MDAVVGVVTEQLQAVRSQIQEIEQEQARLLELGKQLKAARRSERKLTYALSKLTGDNPEPRSRRRPAEIEAEIRTYLASQPDVVSLTQIAHARKLPMSSVRNALLRMDDVVRGPGRLWGIAR